MHLPQWEAWDCDLAVCGAAWVDVPEYLRAAGPGIPMCLCAGPPAACQWARSAIAHQRSPYLRYASSA